MVNVLYDEVDNISQQVEAERLATLADSAAWAQPQHRLLADLIRLNGVGAMLWCCAPLTLEMLHALWDEEPQPGLLTATNT